MILGNLLLQPQYAFILFKPIQFIEQMAQCLLQVLLFLLVIASANGISHR